MMNPASVKLDLASIEAEPLSFGLKGLPASAEGKPLGALGALGLSLLDGDLSLPAAILRDSALTHNSEWMQSFTERAAVSLCPHGKTTMPPQLFQRQFDHGAWGMTAATAAQVRIYRRFGVPRIILANQLVGPADMEIVFRELERDPDLDLYLLVDSLAGLNQLKEAIVHRGLTRPVQVLLEVGKPNGRTGVRTLEQGIELGRLLRDAAAQIAFRGIEGFEAVGKAGHGADQLELIALTMMDTICQLAAIGAQEAWFSPGEVILTGGGSSFFDLVARELSLTQIDRPLRVVLRSGCYLSHDSLFYARMQSRMRARSPSAWGAEEGLRNALEVWAHVQSVPESTRAICALGKRDVSFDIEHPQPLWWFRRGLHTVPQPAQPFLRVTALNDHHAYVDSEGEPVPWRVGDLVGFGIAHPCTTFDKWPLLYCVDDKYKVLSGIRTFF